MYVVVAEFVIDPGQLEAFMPLIRKNAQSSIRDEPGCHQFDVCVSTNAATKILLYEVYDDDAAFEAHLASQHFKEFAPAVEPMIIERSVRMFRRDG